MKVDANPSVIFGLYCPPEEKAKFIEQLKWRGLYAREISFIDVSIPLDHTYHDHINFFKHFVMREYWRERNPLFANFMFKDKIIGKLPFKPVEFNKTLWNNDQRHDLLLTLAVPLMYQDQTDKCETPTERINMENLKTFASEGYKSAEQLEEEKLTESILKEAEVLPDE